MKQTRTSAFTLVELLVVIAVIGILAGLMVPLVQGMHKRALLSEAKDLCIQVADAWALLPIDQGRFPQTDLIKEEAAKSPCGWSTTYEDDLVFVMNPATGNLLNFWRPVSPLPQTDPDVYKKNAKKNNLKTAHVAWSGGSAPSVAEAEKWAADTRFERSVAQKRFGILPMGNLGADDKELLEGMTEEARDKFLRQRLVVVMLDTNGDGVVHPDNPYWESPEKMWKLSRDGNDETPAVRRRAVAWCQVTGADDAIAYSWK